jgi:hypothetical protein
MARKSALIGVTFVQPALFNITLRVEYRFRSRSKAKSCDRDSESKTNVTTRKFAPFPYFSLERSDAKFYCPELQWRQ